MSSRPGYIVYVAVECGGRLCFSLSSSGVLVGSVAASVTSYSPETKHGPHQTPHRIAVDEFVFVGVSRSSVYT